MISDYSLIKPTSLLIMPNMTTIKSSRIIKIIMKLKTGMKKASVSLQLSFMKYMQ